MYFIVYTYFFRYIKDLITVRKIRGTKKREENLRLSVQRSEF